MKKRFRFFVGILFLAFCFNLSNNANATKLPNDVWSYVKSNLPNAIQRFDSVILVNDEVMYVPLYPPTNTEVNSLKAEYSFPANESLKQLPQVLLLNNGYSFLKIFKDSKGNYSLTQKDDLPTKVRLGLMPQDMLVPLGLKVPESLKLTLGDLLIPSKEENSLVITKEDKNKIKNSFSPTVNQNQFAPLVDLKDKKTLINPKNSKFIEVFDNSTKDPLYELKLSSMPLKIITSKKTSVALITYWSGKKAEIMDLKDENIISTIELDANATDVVLNEKDNLAYISSQNANAIYVVDLNAMKLNEVIKLDQKPSKLGYCELDNSITFFDEFSSKVYLITKNATDYIVQTMGVSENVSKLINNQNYIYSISRTQSAINIFDKITLKQLDSIDLDKKPTDAILYNDNIYVLCSKEGYLDVYSISQNKIISREQLSKDGFYSKITLIPNQNNIIISGLNSRSYLIYNLETMKVTKKQDSYIDVANIIILDKAQKL